VLPIDDRDWLEDFRIPLKVREITDYASAIDETLIFTRSRPVAALWLTAFGTAGYVAGGLLGGSALRSSWWLLLAYFAALPALWALLRWITGRLLGTAMRFQGLSLFFFTWLMGFSAIWGAGFESRWWGYGISVGMGTLLGLVYGSLDPTAIRTKEIWIVGLPLGALGTFATTYVQRHYVDPATLEGAAISSVVGGLIFAAPMMILLAWLWDNSRGPRQLGILFLHHASLLPQSIDQLSRALAASRDDIELLGLRGLAYSRLGEAAKAEADWRRATELDPNNSDAPRHRAEELIRQGSTTEAIAALEALADSHPHSAAVQASLGIAYALRGDSGRSLKSFDRSLQLESRRPSAYVHRAQVLLATGDLRRAGKDCDQALSIIPTYALAHLVRGRVLVRLGDTDKAIDDFEEALDGGDDATADEARREIDALENLASTDEME
jgi:Tfp pilus assembly protein PilF